jgi:hypothetical protein
LQYDINTLKGLLQVCKPDALQYTLTDNEYELLMEMHGLFEDMGVYTELDDGYDSVAMQDLKLMMQGAIQNDKTGTMWLATIDMMGVNDLKAIKGIAKRAYKQKMKQEQQQAQQEQEMAMAQAQQASLAQQQALQTSEMDKVAYIEQKKNDREALKVQSQDENQSADRHVKVLTHLGGLEEPKPNPTTK